MESVVPSEVDERAIVDDVTLVVLAGDRRLHAIVEDLVRHATERREGGQVAAQEGLQILVHDEAGPDHPAVSQRQRE